MLRDVSGLKIVGFFPLVNLPVFGSYSPWWFPRGDVPNLVEI
jgi:hypothetical protein